MKTELFNYNLPQELIAQTPAEPRDSSRLLVYSRKSKNISHDIFSNLKKYLNPGDVLVFNNSKVFPARIKINNGEIFLLCEIENGYWECLVRGKEIKRYKDIKEIKGLEILDLQKLENRNWKVKFSLSGKDLFNWLDKNGETPLPPYIKKSKDLSAIARSDSEERRRISLQYQTVYAQQKGSVAAPTAGLHFTKELIQELKDFGIQIEFVTLHVGLGTFSPVKAKKIQNHKIHSELGTIDSETCDRLNLAKKSGRRIIAVGTTSVRVLESATNQNKIISPINKWIDIFITPKYKFRFVDGLITNFHLPKSSLLMLVSAFLNQQKPFFKTKYSLLGAPMSYRSTRKKYGVKKIKQIYQIAIEKKYRFYSFGDVMLIL